MAVGFSELDTSSNTWRITETHTAEPAQVFSAVCNLDGLQPRKAGTICGVGCALSALLLLRRSSLRSCGASEVSVPVRPPVPGREAGMAPSLQRLARTQALPTQPAPVEDASAALVGRQVVVIGLADYLRGLKRP
jgi:hypothetical protein